MDGTMDGWMREFNATFAWLWPKRWMDERVKNVTCAEVRPNKQARTTVMK